MPIEIRELHIKMSVSDQGGQAGAGPSGPGGSGGVNKDKVVAECVEQVMEILRQKLER